MGADEVRRWKLLEKRNSAQKYLSRNWNFENSERLIISDGARVVEASVFKHLFNGQHIKTVVELPTSFGCQVRCAHCASGDINIVRGLSAADLWAVYSIAAQDLVGYRLISFSGIGECSLNESEVFSFVREVSKGDSVSSTLTTVGIRPNFIAQVDRLAEEAPIKLLQVSLFSYDPNRVRFFLGPAFVKYRIDHLLAQLEMTRRVSLRLNLVLIADLNDRVQDWAEIAQMLARLKSRITIRVSLLNETNVSRMNGLLPTSRRLVVECASWLSDHGFQAYPFMSAFNDNMNCGQLAWEYAEKRKGENELKVS